MVKQHGPTSFGTKSPWVQIPPPDPEVPGQRPVPKLETGLLYSLSDYAPRGHRRAWAKLAFSHIPCLADDMMPLQHRTRSRWRARMMLAVVALLASAGLVAGILWVLTMIENALLGLLPPFPGDPYPY
jgi:hypothetical protein